MKYLTLILAISLFIIIPAKSNNDLTQAIRGTVVDATTGYPLAGANVILLNSNPPVGATTDMNGNFELRNIPVGRQSVEFRYIGYKHQTVSNLLLISGKEVILNIRLEERTLTMDEVVVKANKRKDKAQNEMAVVSARTFSVEETERFAGSLGDPARMVANYAGVMTQNDSRNDIIIRGNSPMGVLWRLEGIEIPNPNHFGALGTTGGPVSMVNNNLLANSDFLTGAFPAEYGNATAGAFDLNLRSGNNQQSEFTGQIGFNGFEFGAEGPMWQSKKGIKSSYLANYRYSTLDVFDKLGFSIGTGTTIPEYQDLTFLVDVPGTKAGRIKVFGLYGNSFISLGRDPGDSTDNSYNARGTATDFGSGLMVVGASHTYYLNNKMRIKSTLSYQTTQATAELDSLKNNGEQLIPWIRSYQSEAKLSLSSQFKHKINSRSNYSFGFIVDKFQVDYLDSMYYDEYDRFLRTTDLKGNLSLFRTYAQWQHKFSDNIIAYGGLHTMYFEYNDEFVVEPRLSLQWQFAAKHSISAGLGKHSQLQPKLIYFIQTYDSISDSYSKTNEDVKFLKSNHYVLSYNYLINNDIRIKIETYYQNLYDVPIKKGFPEFSLINSGGDFGIPREDSLINEGTGYNYGLEFTVEKFLNNGYYFLITASVFDSKYKGYDGITRNTAYNGNYVFNILSGYEYKFSEKAMLTFDIKTVWAGGKRYVPIDLEKSIGTKQEERDYTHAYESKYDDYFRTDLRIGFKLNGKRATQEWGLDLQNLTGYQSIFTEGYDSDKQEIYKVHQQGFLPMMLYRIQF
jgi:hypothetical protein